MTDLDTRIRAGLAALVDDLEPLPRAVVVPPRRRWPLVAAGLAGSLVLGGVATAAGVLPDPVRDRFEEMVGWGHSPDVDPDAAHLVATDQLDGIRYELWVSTGDQGTTCDWVRVLEPGAPENGGYGCHPADVLVFQRDDLWFQGSSGASGQYQLDGRAPQGTASVGILYEDGTAEHLPVSVGGWFLDVRREPLKRWRSYVAYDAAGQVLARFDQP
ncbi:MAG: hypothetical protein JWN67_4832 [Actinomycetia bacterium]|nr:hypothetical protein [Actinomycetes bacterium]